MLAIVSDIHGNLPALEAVIADARARGAERFVLCGDYAGFGAWPAETVARAEELRPLAMLRGNHERWLIDGSDIPFPAVAAATAWTADQLGAATVTRLGGLPSTATIDATLYCHASPPSDMASFLPAPDAALEAELLAGVAAPRVVFGHTHLQFRRRLGDGTELVNPGSAGMPFDGDPRAAYATLGEDGITLRRVAYDIERTAAALEAVGQPWGPWLADIVRTARFALPPAVS